MRSFAPHPSCVAARLAGKNAQAPKFPFCCLRSNLEGVGAPYDSPGSAGWWGAEFQIGRAPFDSKYYAARHALFASFAPVERALAPIYHFLVSSRAATLRGDAVPGCSDVRASSTLNLGRRPVSWRACCVRLWATFRSPSRRLLRNSTDG